MIIRRRSIGALAICVLATGVAASFVLLHSGAEGDRICAHHGSGGPGTPSLRPLGTVCKGGFPEQTWVWLNPLFVVAVAVSLWLAIALACLLRRYVARR
jgi:hypothetical protein